MLLNAPCVDGLKDRPTRSRGAKRPPTRSRVPWTRRTSPPSGRNPPSTSRILLAPPRTAGAWSSAPRGESGRTLRGGRESKATFIKMHSPPPLDVSPGSAAAWIPGPTLTRRRWLRVLFRGAHRRRLHMLVLTVRSRFGGRS